MPLSCSNFSAIAWRNSGIPELGVYFVNPDSNAAIAAALMCSGVSKSGSPAPKLQTSSPSDFIAFALLSTEREREGVRLLARDESCIKPFRTICVSHLFQPRIWAVSNKQRRDRFLRSPEPLLAKLLSHLPRSGY